MRASKNRLQAIYVSALVAAASWAATAASAQTAFPEHGRPITIIVPFSAGGSVDVSARLLAPLLEKELGTPVQVQNKPGAGSQLGIGTMARAKPDGYTLAYTLLPLTVTTYLNPQVKASFGRKDLQPLAMHTSDAQYLAVPANSRFKSFKEIIEAARANPEKIITSATGNYSPEHLAILQLEKATGTKFAIVFFDGGSAQTAALLGGHVDFQLSTLGNFTSAYKAGKVKFLAVSAHDDEPRSIPEIPTIASQGHPIYSYVSRGISVPAGTPPAVVDRLTTAIRKAMEDPAHKEAIADMNMTLMYMDPAKMGAFWDDVERQTKPLLMQEVVQK
jgi:tripartite-type tricarboxylate transporter receptor subunit TctC